MSPDLVIVAGARTPMAEYTGALNDMSAIDLGAIASRAAIERSGFSKEGSVTAGNASGIVDGAAAVVVTTLEKAHGSGRQVLGAVRAWETTGVEPSRMGIGPAPAIRRLLSRAGLGLGEVDLFEINEAFAAQYLAVEKDLGLDRERVNVNGGAIALGHPLGATGARLVLTLLYELGRRKARYGVAAACIGGGQGIAMLVERI